MEAKILEEIKEHLFDNGKSKDLNINGPSKLVYLHRAICETLRLFPPIPFEHKFSVQYDILPSGHSIRPNTTILCYTQWEGWRADGVKIARTSSQRDGFQRVEE